MMIGFKEYTVLRLAQQIIARLKVLVDHNIVHGDIQPGNFLLGKDIHTNRTVFLIDFGLSSVIQNVKSSITTTTSSNTDGDRTTSLSTANGIDSLNSDASLHSTRSSSNIANTISKEIVSTKFGTLQFASAHTLEGSGSPPVFRDDLESCAYTLSYLLLGHLPWTHQDMAIYTLDNNKQLISNDPSEYYSRRQQIIQSVIDMKKRVTISDLCESFVNTGIGEVINQLLLQSKQLQADEKPDYSSILSVIDKLLLDERKESKNRTDDKENDNHLYDWEMISQTHL